MSHISSQIRAWNSWSLKARAWKKNTLIVGHLDMEEKSLTRSGFWRAYERGKYTDHVAAWVLLVLLKIESHTEKSIKRIFEHKRTEYHHHLSDSTFRYKRNRSLTGSVVVLRHICLLTMVCAEFTVNLMCQCSLRSILCTLATTC